MCSFFFNGFKKMRCYFSIYNNSNVLTEVIPRPVAWCNVHFIHIYNLYILDRHQVWRSHDPTSVRNFPFCEKKKDFIPQVTTGYHRLPQVTTGFIHIFFFLLKRHNFFFSHLPDYLPGYPPGYLPSYLHGF